MGENLAIEKSFCSAMDAPIFDLNQTGAAQEDAL
jgi:hypothetical protein